MKLIICKMKKNKKSCKCEEKIINWMSAHGVVLLRISIGIVFLWFGLLKLFPGISSAEQIATRTIEVLSLGIVKAPYAMPILATWEVLIGLGFLTGLYLRITFILLFAQMVGTFAPLFVFTDETFNLVPWAPTLTGQYIIKNIVIITSAMVVLANSHGKVIFPRNKKEVTIQD